MVCVDAVAVDPELGDSMAAGVVALEMVVREPRNHRTPFKKMAKAVLDIADLDLLEAVEV